jgi:hypothetical protein
MTALPIGLVSGPRSFDAVCLVASSISNAPSQSLLIGTVVDQEVDVAPGITSSLRELVNEYNFSVIHVIPTGGTPVVTAAIHHAGTTSAWSAQVRLPI